MEEWRKIEGWGNKYEVSNTGKVRTNDYNKQRILKELSVNTNRLGYAYVTLSYRGKSKKQYVHRLVATAFLPNDKGLEDVNHIDENPSNNHVSNLEWTSHIDNCNHGNRNKKIAAVKAKNKEIEANSWLLFGLMFGNKFKKENI